MKRKKIRWVTVRGGLPPGLDVSNREVMMLGLARTGLWKGDPGRMRNDRPQRRPRRRGKA